MLRQSKTRIPASVGGSGLASSLTVVHVSLWGGSQSFVRRGFPTIDCGYAGRLGSSGLKIQSSYAPIMSSEESSVCLGKHRDPLTLSPTMRILTSHWPIGRSGGTTVKNKFMTLTLRFGIMVWPRRPVWSEKECPCTKNLGLVLRKAKDILPTRPISAALKSTGNMCLEKFAQKRRGKGWQWALGPTTETTKQWQEALFAPYQGASPIK